MAARREDITCFLCDYWWLLLALITIILTVVFTRGLWGPLVFPNTTITQAQEPQISFTPVTAPTQLGTGDVQVTLRWEGANDLDLHVMDPAGEEIFYQHKNSASNGELDVDANQGCHSRMDQPVENIFWPTSKAPTGSYKVAVAYYSKCENSSEGTPFTVEVLIDGKSQSFQGQVNTVGETVQIYSFQR